MIDTATPVAPAGASTEEDEAVRFGTGRLHVPGVASLGAGAVHAVAVGVHGDTTQAAVAFTAAAAFQLGWGAWAIVRPSKLVAALGALGNGAVLAAWLVSTRSGISFVDGLETAKPVELGDGIAAGLAALAVGLSLATLARPVRPIRLEQRVLASVASVAVAFVVLAGMIAAAQPSHHAADAETSVASARPAAAVAPVPYDPTRPIDLGGVEGVSAEQQARAENLIANTLSHLPTYDDPTAAEADGYRSINDGGTGYEHYINGEYRTDGRVLDPDRPESLVYQVRNGEKQLVAAMYMAEPGTTLETTPDIGGPLTQWHIHDNLCFAESGQVAGLTDASGGCAPPLVKPEPVPMIHVWIVPHPCGPFAALEGIAGGSIKPGEQRLCDTAHGGH